MLSRSLLARLKIHSAIRTTIGRDRLLLAPVPRAGDESAWTRSKSFKRYLDYSRVPKLDEADLEEQYVRGSGPGGQATNKTNNAVVLQHKPTGIVVKCHETRSQWHNRERARELMVTKLDNLLNKEHSIEAQTRALETQQTERKEYKRRKLAKMKKAFQEREGLT